MEPEKIKVWVVQVGGKRDERRYLGSYASYSPLEEGKIPYIKVAWYEDRDDNDWMVEKAVENGAIPFRTKEQAQKELDAVAKEIETLNIDSHFLTIEGFRVHGKVIGGYILMI